MTSSSIAQELVNELLHEAHVVADVVDTGMLDVDRIFTFNDGSILHVEIEKNKYKIIIKE